MDQQVKPGSRIERRQRWWKTRNTDESDPAEGSTVNKACQIPRQDPTIVDTNDEKKIKSNSGKSQKKKKQYVLFVGNLPFSATKEDLMLHFNSTDGLIDVRMLTKKGSGESRGCAYVEFDNVHAHKRGLLLHMSLLNGRQINVEFTSPGRKTPLREERLKEKNRRAARFKKPRS